MTVPQIPTPAGVPDQSVDPQWTETEKIAAQAMEQGSGVDRLTQLATGNTHLVTNPGLMNALYNSNATPQQAGLINQFMAALDAEKQVQNARDSATGTPIVLSDYQTSALDSMGVKYQDVAQSSSQALNQYQTQLNNNGMTLARDQNNQLILNQQGMPVVVPQPTQQKKGGGFSFGRIVGDVLGAIVKPANVVLNEAGPVVHGLEGVLAPTWLGFPPQHYDTQAQQDEYQKAAGYSTDFAGTIAYQASGKDRADLTQFADQWDKTTAASSGISGHDALIMAIRYANNPVAFRQSIENNPNATTEQKATALETLFGKDGDTQPTAFVGLVKQVGGSGASLGNVFARGLGLDPVKNPHTYSWVSGGTDFAASLVLDPTLLLGKVAEADKLLQLGIKGADGAVDFNKVRAFFTPVTDVAQYPRLAIAQSRWQDFIDQNVEIRRVADLGSNATDADLASAAAAQRKIIAAHPEKMGLQQDFTGAHALQTDSAGKLILDHNGELLRNTAKPITSLEEAGDYMASKMALVQLSTGKAALEGAFMPGSTSLFGLKALKGNLAAMSTKAGVSINLRHLSEATSVLPTAALAVNADGAVVAAEDALTRAAITFQAAEATSIPGITAGVHAANQMAYSEAAKTAGLQALATAKAGLTGNTAEMVGRHIDDAVFAIESGKNPLEAIQAAQDAARSDRELAGQVQNNLLKRGTVNGVRAPGDLMARMSKRAARLGELNRRMTRLLPRNNQITLGSADAGTKINSFMQLYTTQADAALATALWNGGNEGMRRALVSGIQLQVAHAAGWGATDAGRQGLKDLGSLYNDSTKEVLDAAKSSNHLYSPKDAGGLDVIADPQLGGREAHFALHPGQVNETWTLKSFAELRRDAERFGIYDKTIGRAFNTTFADTAMHAIKLAWLMSPKTWTRNALEGWANAAMRGEATSGFKAGLLARLKDRQVTDALIRQGRAEGWDRATLNAKIKEATALPERGVLNSVMRRNLFPHVVFGRWYNNVLGKMFDENDPYTSYLIRFLSDPSQGRQAMDGFSQQMIHAETDAGGHMQRLALHEDGYSAREVKFKPEIGRQVAGYEDLATTGHAGLTAYENALGARLEYFPQYGKELLNAARPGSEGDLEALKSLIANDPEIAKRTQQMRLAGVYTGPDGRVLEATTDTEKNLATEQLLRKQIADVKYHLTGMNGKWSGKIDSYFMAHGKVPDAKWIADNVPAAERPAASVAPMYIAKNEDNTPAGFINKMFQAFDHGYKRMVEDPIQRTTTMPLYAHYYAQSRTDLMHFESRLIVDHGFTPEAAENIVHNYAQKQAWVKTEATVDDPGARTQLNVAGRNFFAFSRAAQAMIRRWSQLFIQNPAMITRTALGVQAAEHSGLVWQDANGEWNFSYPTFAPFVRLLNEATGKVPILKDWLQLPTTDLTGKVLLSVPGVNQTLNADLSAGGILGAAGGLTPLVNTPFRVIENFIGHTPGIDPSIGGSKLATLMSEFDMAVNGPVGAGQIGAQFEPALFSKWIAAFSHDQQNGMLASATIGALTNYLAVHGESMAQFEQLTTDEQQQIIDGLQAQVRNQLRVRAALGMYLPSAPSSPHNQAGNPADFEFAITGTHGLSDEFKQMINDYGGDYSKALQMWTALHPTKLVYAQPTSGSLANKAYMPATLESLTWTENNADFIHQYKSIAGYFMPQTQGAFNPTAYQMQLSLGLRQKDTPMQFLQTALVRAAYPEYDAWIGQFKSAADQAKAAGNTDQATMIGKAETAWRAQFLAAHPTFKQYMGATQAVTTNEAANALAELRTMLAKGDTPSGVNTGALSEMIGAWDQYDQWKASVGSSTTAERDQRTVAAAALQAYMANLVSQAPELGDIYNGVFRRLDSKLVDLNASN